MLGSRGALGVITCATIRIRALPGKEEHRAYLFPDFASGLAALREAQRTRPAAHLRCACRMTAETRLSARPATGRTRTGSARTALFDVYLSVRRFDGSAARLVAGFAGSESDVTSARKRFDSLAKRLGAFALGRGRSDGANSVLPPVYRRDTLLDRGVAMDRLDISASWTKLPALCRGARGAETGDAQPCPARRRAWTGVVPGRTGALPTAPRLTFTWLFPRILDDGLAQAESIRQCRLAAASSCGPGASRALHARF